MRLPAVHDDGIYAWEHVHNKATNRVESSPLRRDNSMRSQVRLDSVVMIESPWD